MWVLQPRRALWHCHDSAGTGIALCGAQVPAVGHGREQENRPVGFDGLLCNKCWFAAELIDTLADVSDSKTRGWLETLNYSELTDSETDKLCAELGENRALSLVVIHGLAVSSEPDSAPKPVSLPAKQQLLAESTTLAVIPLIYREPPQAVSPEESDEAAAESESEGPKMKVNCTRFNSTTPGRGGLNRFLKRLGRSQE